MLSIGIQTHKRNDKTIKAALTRSYKTYVSALSKSRYPIQFASQFNLCINRTGALVQWKDKDTSAQTIYENKWNVLIHGPYNHKLWSKSFDKMVGYLKDTFAVGAWGFVIHIPKRDPAELTGILNQFDDYLEEQKIDRSKLATLVLEQNTLKHDDLCSYELPSQLNRFGKLLMDAKLKFSWGFCLDTAHMWSSISEHHRQLGYTIETHNGFFKWFSELDVEVVKKLVCIHFNGSKKEHSSNVDEHEIPLIGEDPDHIWGNCLDNIGESSIPLILSIAYAQRIPLIMEVNSGTDQQIYTALDKLIDIFNEYLIS
jgi:endonuclease IV